MNDFLSDINVYSTLNGSLCWESASGEVFPGWPEDDEAGVIGIWMILSNIPDGIDFDACVVTPAAFVVGEAYEVAGWRVHDTIEDVIYYWMKIDVTWLRSRQLKTAS